MTCAACAVRIETSAKRLPGVVDAVANYGNGTATFTYDPDAVRRERIIHAVEKAGYSVIEGDAQAIAAADAKEARTRRTDLIIALVFAVPLTAYAMAGMFGVKVPFGDDPSVYA